MAFLSILAIALSLQAPESYLIEPKTDAVAKFREDGRIALSWKYSSSTIRIFRSDNPSRFPKDPIVVLHSVNETVLDGLNKPTRTYFKLDFGHGKTLEVSDRFLHFSNANNFRDLGGYRTSDGHHTKWGLLFRSNSLHDLLGEYLDEPTKTQGNL